MSKALYHVGMSFPLFPLSVDRNGPQTLAAQIHGAIRAAILDGRLAPGDRLPSWRDLAARLGVARGTVKAAYERLIDEQLAAGMGAAGTRVSGRVPSGAVPPPGPASGPPLAPVAAPVPAGPLDQGVAPLPFQMGVPAQDAFPRTVWSRLLARAARDAALAPAGYPDPRGDPVLRREIAAGLAIARGVRCSPDQVLITAGYAGALGLAVHALRLWGGTAWMEEPGFPQTRQALELAGMKVAAVPVDEEGLRVADGARLAPDAALVVVTPGQQAPLGVTMSLERRLALLDWARRRGAWVLEDDYLSELQLKGRAAPALASLEERGLEGAGRVLHAGTFSKTISPALRLGFLVVPPDLAAPFAEVAARLAPAPAAPVQRAVAAFMADGHYLRHVRRMKRLYAARRQALADALTPLAAAGGLRIAATAGLSLVVRLPVGTDDVALARQARLAGLAPAPLSPWYRRGDGTAGFLLGVTNADERRVAAECQRLVTLVTGA